MAYNEEDYLMLSGIQHFVFCRRQWALIHIEQEWEDNVLTIEGHYVHEKVDQPFFREKRKETLYVRALPVKSHILGITGICDMVEFTKSDKGVSIFGEAGLYIPRPVEYKRGKPKLHKADILQLTAQVMCLEEMLLTEIKEADLFYHEIKRRETIMITNQLRERVKKITKEMHHYYSKKHTPRVKVGKHCNNCSLKNRCLPELVGRESVKTYIRRMLKE